MKRTAPIIATALLLLSCATPPSAPDLKLLDLDGNEVDPLQSDAVSVFVFTRTDCPISNRYAPEIRRIYERFEPQGVAFWLVYVDPDESAEVIRGHLADYAYPLPALRDPRHALVSLTGASVTPEAAVFVGPERMIYRGRIDDWYVDFGKSRAAATRHDLQDVLQALLDGHDVTPSTTPTVGCFIADLE